MPEAEAIRDVQPIALRPRLAAEALGMSDDSFARYVAPTIRIVRCGRMRLIPVTELEAWVERNAACVSEGWS